VRGRGLLPIAVWLIVVAASVLAAVLPLIPPEPAASDAPAEQFSARRALTHLPRIAAEPHPVGSAAHDRVRDYLTDQFAALGLRPETQRVTTAAPRPGRTHHLGQVTNVSATVAGRDPSAGRVYVVAHYDSTPNSFGATDNGIGLLTLLEVGRALGHGPRPRTDVVLVATDGEEVGLLGAHAFATGHAGDAERGAVVLNLDARGTSGPAIMFQTGPGNARAVAGLRSRPPVATSLSAAVYEVLPNDTDFTEFRQAGFGGLNFALVGQSARYDNPTDSVASFQPASLQDLGATVLAAVRVLGEEDLAPRGGADSAYFSVAGVLVRYPMGWELPLAVLAVLATAAAGWYARRRERLTPRGFAVVTATVPALLVACAAIGWLAGQLLLLARPRYGGFAAGSPYGWNAVAAGIAVVALAVAAGWLLWLRRRRGHAEILAGLVAWFAVLAVLLTLAVPGAGYAFTWPALVGAAALAATARLPRDSRWLVPLAALPAVPALVLLLPVIVLLFPALGLPLLPAPLVLVGLVAALVLAPVAPLAKPVGATVPTLTLALVGVLGTTGAVAADRTDAGRPAQVSLVYLLDGDSGRAWWASAGPGDGDWIDRYVDGPHRPMDESWPMLLAPGGYRIGDAPAAGVPAPSVTLLESRREGDVRQLRLRVDLGRPATVLAGYVDTTSAEVLDAGFGPVAGGAGGTAATAGSETVRLDGGRNRSFATSPWKWGFEYAAPPAGGVELTLRTRGSGTTRLRLVTRSAGIPASALDVPLPGDVTWSSVDAGETLAARTVRF